MLKVRPVLIGVIVLAAGWQTLAWDGGAPSVRDEATAQQTRQASAEPEVSPTDDGSSTAPEASAGSAQTKRLVVENVLQVGGFGCVSCAIVIEETLQEADGVEGVTYKPKSDTYLVMVNGDFLMDEVAEQILDQQGLQSAARAAEPAELDS